MATIKMQAGTASNGRGPSPIVWGEIPIDEINSYPGKGWGFFDDFIMQEASTGGTTRPGYIVTAITSGTLVDGGTTAVGGILSLTPSGTENQGIELQTPLAYMPNDGEMIAFGARLAVTDVDQADLYVGLSTADTAIAGSIANDVIGLGLADGSANLLYYVTKNDSGADGTDTTADLTDATYVRLEGLITEEKQVQLYVDGVRYANYTTAANIVDDEELAMSVAIINGTGSANIVYLDWLYCYQWYI